MTAVPIEVAVQKLRGFVADQNAKIVKTNDNELQLIVTDSHSGSARRTADRSVTFSIQLKQQYVSWKFSVIPSTVGSYRDA